MRLFYAFDPQPTGHPTVLLLHGLGANYSCWTPQFPALIQAGFRPLAPDLPGFGASAYDGRGWNFPRLARLLANWLQEIDVENAHVVGLSMGGVLAQQFAHDFPQRVGKLVLVSTFAVLRPDSLAGWWYFLQRLLAVLFLGPQAQAQLVARRVFPRPEQALLRQMFLETIAHADQRAYRSAMRALATFDSRPWLGQISAPTLVITGERDTTISPKQQQLLAGGIPGAQQVVIEGAGHAVNIDQPDSFNRHLLEFLL